MRTLGDYKDSGAVPSWQLHEPAIRTGFRNVTEELQEHNISTGYQAEYSSDDNSSEGSFTITLDQEDQHTRLQQPGTYDGWTSQMTVLMMMDGTPSFS